MSKKDEVIRARITPELKEKFETLASQKGMSASEYLRYLIMRELEKPQE